MYELFLNKLKQLGGYATNRQMMAATGMDKVTYIHAREGLKVMKQIVSVRCRGGAVRLVEKN